MGPGGYAVHFDAPEFLANYQGSCIFQYCDNISDGALAQLPVQPTLSRRIFNGRIVNLAECAEVEMGEIYVSEINPFS